MAGSVRTYADAVAAVLGGPGDPQVAQLQAAADGLDTALAAPATLDQAVAAWRAAADALRDRLVSFLLAQVPVPGLPELGSGQGWSGPEGVRLDVAFGPLGLHVASPT
ncbi:MAG: hypothetical protein H7269_12560, partial [Cellulomonas sp.]|nr:hypothetical protein [Cellulomonas sp.]